MVQFRSNDRNSIQNKLVKYTNTFGDWLVLVGPYLGWMYKLSTKLLSRQ